MGPVPFTTRVLLTVFALALLAHVPGCAEGDGGRRDAGATGEGGMDRDSGGGGVDAFLPETDARMPDAGPRDTVMTCEACTTNADCETGSFCANLITGGRACLPGCNPDLPDCPRNFSCIFDASGTGVDATICAPVGGPCCVDEDLDEYGVGVGCMGADCNDEDDTIHPGVTETCDGVDTNCNGAVDEPPTDCVSGICGSDGDGTYSASAAGTCRAATCEDGMVTDCGLYTCAGRGEDGSTCATACDPAGSDDDSYCIASAHCDAGACVPDVTNGNACDEDSDCGSAHCDNGFCCGTGTCCSVVADCPGGGAVTRLCETPADCQGSRGMSECNAASQCVTVAGIPDDRGCTSTTLARDCGLYDPIYCNGTETQTPRSCPTSCLTDTDCIDAAHCTVGVCVPDLPPGGPCARGADCQAGLFCADNVCCDRACTSTCESCRLPGSMGSCLAVPAGADPDGECAGYSCSGYYTGFSGGSDVCSRRADVSDSAAVCDGARMCRSPDAVCPSQPPAATQIDCNDVCQAPVSGTCTGTTAGMCRNLDSPGDTTSCGVGVCARTVQRCTGGVATPCTPGGPTSEVCNGLDDDCDGTPDDGSGASLCPSAPFAMSYACSGGTCSIMCVADRYDLNGSYGDGCECADDTHANACAAATNLGTITVGGSMSITGTIVPTGENDWFMVSFPSTGRGPGNGVPTIRLVGAGAANFALDIQTTCAAAASCGSGTSTGVQTYQFQDNASTGTPVAYSMNSVAWPTTILFRVRRVAATTSCAAAGYTVSVTR